MALLHVNLLVWTELAGCISEQRATKDTQTLDRRALCSLDLFRGRGLATMAYEYDTKAVLLEVRYSPGGDAARELLN